MHTFSFEGIGTRWQVDLYGDTFPVDVNKLQKTIIERVDQFDTVYSRFKKDSFVSTTLFRVGIQTLPEDARPLFSLYENLYKITNGAFTPFIGQVLIDAGYDTDYSLQEKALQSPPSWDEVLDYHFPTVRIKKPEIFDFGAGGKGYIIDLISDVIKKSRITSFCVDAGGDIRYEGIKPLRVGLESPFNTQEAIGVATIQNMSLCGSAGNRRKWGRFHHIIDPRTLSSPTDIAAVWVISSTTIEADALSTCLFLVPPETLSAHYHFEYVILKADNSVRRSKGFPAELFYKSTRE